MFMADDDDDLGDLDEEFDDEQVDDPIFMIKQHVYVALGVGLIPIPLVDLFGVVGIQLNMLRKLSIIYQVPFSQDLIKGLIGALIGGSFPASFSAAVWGSIGKAAPGLGSVFGMTVSAAISGAATYAVGMVFNRHFAEGGTFLSFNPDEAREFYADMLREGKAFVDNNSSAKVSPPGSPNTD